MLQDRRSRPRLAIRPIAAPRLLAFLGPATLVAVGYMDPGNWATDLEGGARFGYRLLWVLVASNWTALVLQTLATRLGVVTGLDLAEACRAAYSRRTGALLWVLAELAIVACDMAEVIGSAIAINLLFGIPLIWGATITVLDVFAVLALHHRGMRTLEAIVVVLIATIAACFAIELFLVTVPIADVASGLVPRLDGASLYLAIGIVGATVMPHSLYLHSSTVKSRPVEATVAARRKALRYFAIDTTLALHVALLVNAAILILSAAVFGSRGLVVGDLRDAHRLLAPLLGSQAAAVLFAVALLAAGQSSTITGTLAGQIVMNGFLNIRLPAFARRAVTRAVAALPTIAVIAWSGEAGTLPLLIASQVVLSLQLPFAIVPLIRLTSSPRWMGHFASGGLLRGGATGLAVLIVALNVALVGRTIVDLHATHPSAAVALAAVVVAALLFLAHIARVPIDRHAPPGDDDDLAPCA